MLCHPIGVIEDQACRVSSVASKPRSFTFELDGYGMVLYSDRQQGCSDKAKLSTAGHGPHTRARERAAQKRRLIRCLIHKAQIHVATTVTRKPTLDRGS